MLSQQRNGLKNTRMMLILMNLYKLVEYIFKDLISEVKQEPKLNKEEARLKALELQRQIREKVKEKERQAEIQREKNRLKQGKEMTEARRIMKENQKKLDLEMLKKRREKDDLERQKLREKLEADKRARFGADYDKKETVIVIKDDFYKIFAQMKKIYRYTDKLLLQNCLKTIGKYLRNIQKKPNETKFQTINTQNKVFVKRISNAIGGINLLKVAGFKEDSTNLVFTGDQEGLAEFLSYLDTEIHKMEMYQG